MFLEDEMMRGSMTSREIDLEEKRNYVPMPIKEDPIFPAHTNVAPPIERIADATPAESPAITTSNAPTNEEQNEDVQQPEVVTNEQNNEQQLRRSQRERRSAIPSDYVTYLSEAVNYTSEDMSEILEDDPTSFKEAMKSEHSHE